MFDDVCSTFFVERMFCFRSNISANISQMLKRLAGFSTLLLWLHTTYPRSKPHSDSVASKMADTDVIEVRTPKRKRSWSEDEVKRLIENYEERPCLWDTFDKEYHNKDRRAIALTQIEEVLNIQRDEFQAKWNMLRGQYSRELQLICKIKSGAGVDEVHCSKWQFFQAMKFLQVVVQARKSSDSLKVNEEETDSRDKEGVVFFSSCIISLTDKILGENVGLLVRKFAILTKRV